MAQESLISDALKTAGLKTAKKLGEKGVKAVRHLPKGKRNKVAGIIVFVATVVFLVLASRKLRVPVE